MTVGEAECQSADIITQFYRINVSALATLFLRGQINA